MFRFQIIACFSILLVTGCAAPHAPTTTTAWTFANHDGQLIRTPHYAIYTTLHDSQTTAELTTLMESALRQYQQLAPGTALRAAPMPCYFFAERSEWELYTHQHTGALAPLYLKINRGGYTLDDTFVAYGIGQTGTFAVAAHEGFHQFVACNFKYRPPPFMEEGLASLFETIRWTDEQPRWDLSITPARVAKLRRARDAHELWPLETLCTMHAGDVVTLSAQKIETFYAQDWAFAQFVARDPRYAPGFKRMLRELASGSGPKFSSLPPDAPRDAWDPQSVQPMFEHYFDVDLPTLSRDYAQFIQRIINNNIPRDTIG